MIIDVHAHACGLFLKGEDIIEILGMNLVDKIVLVLGEYYDCSGPAFLLYA